MKTSTKVWLIVFIVSAVGAALLSNSIFSGIMIGTEIYFNFSALAYVGIVFFAIALVSGTVLYIRFLKRQNFNGMLFFLTVPITILFAVAVYFMSTINTYQSAELEFVRAVLNVSADNNNNYLWVILLTIIYLVFIFISFYIVCRPIKKIEKAVYRLSDGRVRDDIQIGGNKQFETIEVGLNKINENYKKSENLIKKTNLEYEKFIPKQFLKFFGKNSILELELGNQVQREITALFCDVRNSTAMSRSLSLEENFNYINSYLNIVSPIIRKHGGYVDKYLGDGILAVFIKPESAIECSINIVKAVENKNKDEKTPSMEVGISIHTGEVVFGVVGEEERKSLTIISDNVNLASKMEEINKYFGSKIVFSKRTLNNLKINYPLSYRYIGSLTLDDKEYMSMFECLDCYSKQKRDNLEKTKTIFEQAVRQFNLGKFCTAKDNFEKVLKTARDDKVSYMYFNKCETTLCGEAPLRLK